MSNPYKAVIENYCGFKVEVVEITSFWVDEAGLIFLRGVVKYEDGFLKSAALSPTEITSEKF